SSTGKNMSGTGAMRSQAAVAHGSPLTANSIAESGKRRRLGRLARNRYRLGAEPDVLLEKECSMLRRHVCLAVLLGTVFCTTIALVAAIFNDAVDPGRFALRASLPLGPVCFDSHIVCHRPSQSTATHVSWHGWPRAPLH